ncbi:hypothetical protein [Methylobacterium tardum]|uniref:hypothetical protein n=1 Tax=Methylobacterium tardum TaxID=374432 RepID=UPI00202101C3|nr:hypothetical protein [Methylobacterium tardum]URD36857.1 hypothetical protein M6G65_31915 [Methylobacterium tardum]
MRDYGIDELELLHRVTGVCRAPGGGAWTAAYDESVMYPEPVEGGVYAVIEDGSQGCPRFAVMRDGRLVPLRETEVMDIVDPAGIATRRAATDAYSYREREWKGPAEVGFTRTAAGGRVVTHSASTRHFWRQARPEEVAAWDAEHGAPAP